MSGTSQSAAVVSGVAALMLQAEPSLTPDALTCPLIASARPALDASGELAYSPLQQGAGMINAYEALHSSASGCANRGMDVGRDLDGVEHYGGPVNQYADGTFYLMEPGGAAYDLRDGAYSKGDGLATCGVTV